MTTSDNSNEYIGFWDMAERMLSSEGLETLRQESEDYDEAAVQEHERWAERFNEYALGGTDDRPSRVAYPIPASVRWIEELVERHNDAVRANAPIPPPRPVGPDVPF